jgi:hypothetical protein
MAAAELEHNRAQRNRRYTDRPIRVYHLFHCSRGFSVQPIDYGGTVIIVSAVTVRQAYALGFKSVWIDPRDDYPIGIIAIHRKLTATLWCGCKGHGLSGGQVRRGAGIQAVPAAIGAHRQVCERPYP